MKEVINEQLHDLANDFLESLTTKEIILMMDAARQNLFGIDFDSSRYSLRKKLDVSHQKLLKISNKESKEKRLISQRILKQINGIIKKEKL